jgi:osmotically-inducible protein OsmY
VSVHEGVATLSGTVDREVADRAKDKVANVKGITKVKDQTTKQGRRR